MRINTISDFRKAMRNGPYAWPGGYPLYFITNDNQALCFECVKLQRRVVVESIHHDARDGWRVVCVEVNWEDPELHCDDCTGRIQSAYAEDDNA